MSYPTSTRDQFLSLRADGLSYAQCAKQLNVSRHTLIIWAKEMKPHLDAMRAVRTEELLDQVQLRLDQRILLLAALYHKVRQTIESANLLAPGIPRLFTILLKLNTALDKYEMDSTARSINNRNSSAQPPVGTIENPSTSETDQIPQTAHEKTEPPKNPKPEAENTIPQPIATTQLETQNPEPEKTEPKLNHPELSPPPIQNPKSKIQNSLNSELSSLLTSSPRPLSLSELQGECRKKLNQLKTRQAS